MEIFLYKTGFIVCGALLCKFYWDRRDVENKLYIAEHVFFSDEEAANPEVTSNKPKPAGKAEKAKVGND